MKSGTILKTDDGTGGGEYEADETFVGGRAKNMHKDKREKKITGSGSADKEIVMGILLRGSATAESRIIKAKRIPNTTKNVVQAEIRAAVPAGKILYTDALRSYRGLSADYVHEFVDHAIEYVRDHVHTNTLENFWSLFKRGLKGTYISVSPVHLDRYVDEQAFRFNERKMDDGKRFRAVVSSVTGRRLTYDELTGRRIEGKGA